MYNTRSSKRRPEVLSNAEFPTSTTDTVSKTKIKCKKPIQDKKASKIGRNLDRICKKVEDKSSDKENPNKSKRISSQASIKNNLQPLKPSNVQIILTQMQLSEKDKKLNVENPENLKRTRRNLSRKCNKITDKKMDQENQNKTSIDKKNLMKGKHPPVKANEAQKFSTRVQSLKPKKVKELKENKSNSDGNLNNMIKVKKATSTKVKQLEDNYITEAKKDSELPLEYNSEKLVHRVPVWAVSKPLTKQTKRSCLSDIYDINKDENIMNDTPVVKKKKICSHKPKVIKPKVSKKKIGLPHENKTMKTCFQEVNKPVEKFAKIVDIVETNKAMQTIHQPEKKCEDLNSVPIDNDMFSEAFEPNPVNNIEMPVEDFEVLRVNQPFKVKSDAEDSIKECISSFYNFDTSLSISSVFKNKDKLCEVDKTPVKQNSNNAIANFELNVDADNLSEKHIFLVPQMTSTPESAVHPFDPVKLCPKFSSKQIPDVSSIPGSAFRNICKDLSDSELLSPVKSTTDGPEIMPFQSSFDKVRGKEIFKEKTYSSIKNKGKDTLKQTQTVKKKTQSKDMKNIGKLDDHLSSKENGIIPQRNQKKGRKRILTEDINCVNKEVHGIDEDVAALKSIESSNEADKAKEKLRGKTNSEQTALKNSNKDNLSEPVTTIGNDLNTYEVKLFESPIKEELVRKKYGHPVKKTKIDWNDDEEFFSSPEKLSPFSSPLKSYIEEQVLPSKKSYSSNQIKRDVKRKLKVEHKKTHPVTKIDKYIEEMNKHFSDLEDTELIID
ncbi:hypothetical protein TNCT_335571 [Trichonephila clavata]|uniref:Uncharacterized protein n=1 Tax=Trichonephila clavata TaxID=2740835 RepID=A0A8X6LLQ4_TRICU|nr:hypothetical protein TNCT_335571 [Trichonephila clavata]